MQNTQQQLQIKLKNAPTDASQVCSTASSGLNKEETLSVQNKVRACNTLDVNLHQRIGGLKAKVFVLSIDKKPLMPCTPTKARHLLRDKRAEVVSRIPFTIRLLFECENQTQQLTLGIDSGYTNVGYSVTSSISELMAGELKLRTDIPKKLQNRAMYRRCRRNKLWYRKPRFLNRCLKEGWLTPSIEHKVQTHIRLVNKIKRILPITNTIIEVAKFDTQKMQNPEINGVEYQQGELCGYEVREYLLEKYKRTCVYCGKKNVPLQIEHINPKSKGGTNRVSNLTISCESCNTNKGTRTASEFGYPEVEKSVKVTLKSTPFMNVVRTRIVDKLGCGYTYGYVTKHNRIKSNIYKSHINDAFVIANGTTQKRTIPHTSIQVRRNNRCLQKNRNGFKPSIRRQRYKLHPYDSVIYNNTTCIVKGVHCYGTRILITDGISKPKSVNIKSVGLVKYSQGIHFSAMPSIHPPNKLGGFLEGIL